MKKFALLGFLVFSQLFSTVDATDEATRKRMLNGIDLLKDSFDIKYAPASWKQQHFGWDWNAEVENAKAKIGKNKNITTKEYQRIVRNLLSSAKDYHVTAHFYCTESATLPFMIKSISGKFYFVHVDKELIGDDEEVIPLNLPFKAGDELVAFNGMAIQDAFQKFKAQEIASNNPETDQGVAEIFFTRRSASSGMVVPQGDVNITYKNSLSEVNTHTVTWKYEPEEIKQPKVLLSQDISHGPNLSSFSSDSLLFKQMLVPFYQHLVNPKTQKLENENPYILGARDSFLPDLGEKFWEGPDETIFKSYVYRSPDGRKIGYVRIPSYMGENVDQEAKEFAKIIKALEKRTDALVVDQLNNPGGSVLLLYSLASMLTNKPLDLPKQRVTITQEEVGFALLIKEALESISSDEEAKKELGEALHGYPVNMDTVNKLKSYFKFIISEWEKGHYFTDSVHLYNIDRLEPSKEAHYTKPIVFLINSLDFSGGDFLPAILQDNKRATIMGTRTAGAGGYILAGMYPNRFGIALYTFTGSIAERLNGKPIENLGVTPDVEYAICRKDIRNNYEKYCESIHETVNAALKAQRDAVKK